MAVRFLDGPAEGQGFDVHRAPMYVRATVAPDGTLEGGEKWDVLNDPDDEPREDEGVHVYEAVPQTWTFMFVRPGGRYESVDYRHRPDVDGEELRETDAWRAWATAQPPIDMPTIGTKHAIASAEAAQERIRRRIGTDE